MIRAFLWLAFGIYLGLTWSVGAGVVTMLYAAIWGTYWMFRKLRRELALWDRLPRH